MSSPECEHFEERNSKSHNWILLLTQAHHIHDFCQLCCLVRMLCTSKSKLDLTISKTKKQHFVFLTACVLFVMVYNVYCYACNNLYSMIKRLQKVKQPGLNQQSLKLLQALPPLHPSLPSPGVFLLTFLSSLFPCRKLQNY